MENSIQSRSSSPSTSPRETARNRANPHDSDGSPRAHLFASVADSGMADFDGAVVGRRRVTRNASAYREQDHFEALFYVRFGEFKLTRRNSVGEPYVAQFYMAGDLIGLDAIATGRHGYKLTALENSEVCEISFAAMKKIMSSEPKLLSRFLKAMSASLNDQADHCSVLARPSLDGRFAGFLLEMSSRYERLGYSNKSFRLSMTRADIGSYLGTSIESVSRVIARFNAQQSVLIQGRQVEIRDYDYLTSKAAPM